MPIIIEGYITVSTKKLRDHEGHDMRARVRDGLVSLTCVHDDTIIESEPEPRNDLPCGCSDTYEHDEGVRLQDAYYGRYRLSRKVCVGCYTGDDGPSVHSCVIHDKRYWA